MNCPRCGSVELNEREREGILVDSCPSCRGVWLDRGELEKMIARATRELDEVAYRRADAPPDSDREHRHYRDHGGHRRKKSWLESLGDVFD